MGAFSMDLIFERTRALCLAGKVTISHGFCLGWPDRDLVDPMIEAIAALLNRLDSRHTPKNY